MSATLLQPSAAHVGAPAFETKPAARDVEETKPTSEATVEAPTSPVQPQLDAKDRRAYEVARQRAKHPEDRHKARVQKGKAPPKLGQGWFRVPGVRRLARAASIEAEADDAKEGEVTSATGRTASEMQIRDKPETCVGAKTCEVTVRLEDLIHIAKDRKGKAGDFELIPHVRAVIALDDSDFAGEVPMPKISEFDFADWEHVESCSGSSSSDEDEVRKAPSYAQVVSNTRH